MAETENIARMAEEVSEKIFSFLRWERVNLPNTNFDCLKAKEHSKKDKHTHPVDVVFHYLDPYTKKRVLLNTDLKSYATNSITTSSVRSALKSLAYTIDCAKFSNEWNERFGSHEEPTEIRGLLFVYNHQGTYDKKFYETFFIKDKNDKKRRVIEPSSLPLKKNQMIHIIEPMMISYLYTMQSDLSNLIASQEFPFLKHKKHWFYYPDLYLHKTNYNKYDRAASIEMISSPFMIIGHDKVIYEGEELFGRGFLVYYNCKGDTVDEFVYLLDTLSKNQMLDSDAIIRIRCLHPDKNKDITTKFYNAIEKYASAWGFDKFKYDRLQEIKKNFKTVTEIKERISDIDVGWQNDEKE
ncbi:hypothetical protein [Pseudoalteromonas sp. CnMc7-37]|uniref:hypothetical protein n=1 Tax=Pseudoalteromonas sp. CnMc7-37 TaxID=2954496 RepID=UPI0020968257|nr:hypothetical protein [Pseudoalteromonas sp. CnMc7-37]